MPQEALVPFAGSWWASLLNSGNNSRRRVDGAIGAAATLGLSIVILKLVAEAFKSAKRNGEESSTFRIVQEILRGLFQRNEEEEEAVDSTDTEVTVLHKGSCHCRSVAFELAAPRTLVAQHGSGKISYAHTRTRAHNFQFVKGTDHLQIYYVSVPAGSEHGGVEPTIGAHTFCSRCGVHILHAGSPTSDVLHVNVSCVDGGPKPKIKWNQRNNLSSGVPVAKQWEEEQSAPSAWGTMESEDVTLESSFADENPDTPFEHSSWKSATREPSPGTPSTVGTVGTDSLRYRPLASLEQPDEASQDSETLPTMSRQKPLLPPLNTSLSTRSVVESPSRKTPTTTTPMMRDQLKYYMSKHLPSSATSAASTSAKANATTPRESQS